MGQLSFPMFRRWRGRSASAYRWICGWTTFWFVAFALGSLYASVHIWEAWTAATLSLGLVLGSLLLAALWMHRRREGRCGLRDVYQQAGAGYAIEPASGVLTALSVRTGILLALLKPLYDARGFYLFPEDTPGTAWAILGVVLAHPGKLAYVTVTALLALALLTTLAALLCFEYAVRFNWSRARRVASDAAAGKPLSKEEMQAIGRSSQLDLVMKGADFSAISFYCLVWSLTVMTVFVDYAVAFIAAWVVYTVMWTYYFFPVKAHDTDGNATASVAQIADAAIVQPSGAPPTGTPAAASSAASPARGETPPAVRVDGPPAPPTTPSDPGSGRRG